MNAKRCKRIRLTLRNNGIDPREHSFVHKEHVLQNPLRLSIQTLLDDACGRMHYKRAKKAVRA